MPSTHDVTPPPNGLTSSRPTPSGLTSTVCLVLVLWGALCAGSAWRVVDLDALSRLAVGRYIAQNGEVPQHDPFTYPRPEQRWSNPEWAGDLVWYGTHSIGGFPALVMLKLALAGVGWALAFALARRLGAAPLLVAALLLMSLPAAAERLHVRNEVHALWLIPLYLLLLQRARHSPRQLWPLIPLAVLWANLHSSFVIGWALIGATLLERALDQPRDGRCLRWLGGLLLAHPLLALVGPNGSAIYAQLFEHLQRAEVYRELILEWIPPAQAGATLAQLPLHLLGIIGLLSFLPRVNRRQGGALVRIGLALALAHGSQRFTMLLPVLAVPDIAANLQRWLNTHAPKRQSQSMAVAASLGLALAAGTIWQARSAAPPQVLERSDAPIGATRVLAAQAPPGSRLFNPYNSGPYLLWLVGPRVQIHIDPRNNLGADLLRHYVEDLVPDTRAFEQATKKYRVDLALVDLSDGRFGRLALHLRQDSGWTLIHFDGRFALHARPDGTTADLVRRRGYQTIEGTLEFEYLAALLPGRTPSLDAELALLDRDAPALARAIRGYVTLLGSGGQPPLLPRGAAERDGKRALHLLSSALPELPPSPALMSYLATAHARLGNEAECLDVLRVAQALFPNAPHILALHVTLARRESKPKEAERWLTHFRQLGFQQHELSKVIGASTARRK